MKCEFCCKEINNNRDTCYRLKKKILITWYSVDVCQECMEKILEYIGSGDRTAQWIEYKHGSGIYCSHCHSRHRYKDIHWEFCPKCGYRIVNHKEMCNG